MISRKGRGFARAMVGLGFADGLIQTPGFGIRFNLLIPHFFAILLKPVGDCANLFGLELLNGRFNFLDRTHGGNLGQPTASGNPDYYSSIAARY